MYDVAKKYMKSRYEQIDLIGKRTQKAATTVEVSNLSNVKCFQTFSLFLCATNGNPILKYIVGMMLKAGLRIIFKQMAFYS